MIPGPISPFICYIVQEKIHNEAMAGVQVTACCWFCIPNAQCLLFKAKHLNSTGLETETLSSHFRQLIVVENN